MHWHLLTTAPLLNIPFDYLPDVRLRRRWAVYTHWIKSGERCSRQGLLINSWYALRPLQRELPFVEDFHLSNLLAAKDNLRFRTLGI